MVQYLLHVKLTSKLKLVAKQGGLGADLYVFTLPLLRQPKPRIANETARCQPAAVSVCMHVCIYMMLQGITPSLHQRRLSAQIWHIPITSNQTASSALSSNQITTSPIQSQESLITYSLSNAPPPRHSHTHKHTQINKTLPLAIKKPTAQEQPRL